jgi:hypothetical protein
MLLDESPNDRHPERYIARHVGCYMIICTAPLYFMISSMMIGVQASMLSYSGILVEATVVKRPVITTHYSIDQKYEYFTDSTSSSARNCTVQRLILYGNKKGAATAAASSVIGSQRHIWLSNTNHDICFDRAEIQYHFIVGMSLLIFIFLYGGFCCRVSYVWFKREHPYLFEAPAEPEPEKEIDPAILDVGLK